MYLKKTSSVTIPKKGTVFTERELQAQFNVANMGGIRSSTKNRVIILINSYFSDYMGGYDDKTNFESNTITYVGHGQNDQVMSRSNKSLRYSKQNGYTVLYFDKPFPNRIIFRCQVEYAAHSFGRQKNDVGRLRRVILFELKTL